MKHYLRYSLLFIIFFQACERSPENQRHTGEVFGTYYNITYHAGGDNGYQKSFDSIFKVINSSLSTYQKDSEISKFNRNEPMVIDDHFRTVFNASKKIFKETQGVFDPTIGNVVNAWNFGPDENKFLTNYDMNILYIRISFYLIVK